MSYYFGRRSKQVLQTLHPLLRGIMVESIKTSPHDFGLHKGYRSIEEQHQRFLEGSSHIDGITKRGYHNYKPALAVDYHMAVPGKTWDEQLLEEVARHIQKVAREKFDTKITWGGDWKSIHDADHLQLPKSYKDGAEKRKLF